MIDAEHELPPTAEPPFWLRAAAALVIVVAGSRAYLNSLRLPFVYDDLHAIVENQTIRSLKDIGTVLSPPGEGVTVDGRPVLNLSFALNYAVSEFRVWSWHAANIAIHLLAGLCLFGIVRRTLSGSGIPERQRRLALPLAFAVALLWTLHPLETESVTYTVQRAESLAGLLLLATLYCSIRAGQSPVPLMWQAAAFTVCLVGMGAKEIMVAAPILVVLHDWTFQGGTLAAALKRRGWFYAGLFSTWALLGLLVVRSAGRGGTAGFGGEISSWEYLLTQFGFVLMYLKLSFWPHPLVLDYGTGISTNAVEYVPAGLAVLALAVGTIAALCRASTRWLGFLGMWFFCILAPSSSIVPVVTQTGAEHRMYLPLAAIVVLAVLAADHVWGRISARWPPHWQAIPATAALVAVAITFGILTHRRNLDYQSQQSIWRDTVQKLPLNWRGYCNLGWACKTDSQYEEALAAYDRAIQLYQNDRPAFEGRAETLMKLRRYPEAIRDLQHVVEMAPRRGVSHANLAIALTTAGESDAALAAITEASRLVPSNPYWHRRRGGLLGRLERHTEALDEFTAAIRLKPNWDEAYRDRGSCFQQLNRSVEAIADFSKAIAIAPRDAVNYLQRGIALTAAERFAESAQDCSTAIDLKPELVDAYRARAISYLNLKHFDLARADLEKMADLGAPADPALLDRLKAVSAAPNSSVNRCDP
ncbi:MAG: tetratricopeptide repeat protein [Planctomycetia bacterium]|nr:tetratricopeptide repeat protein [Planctomycetia bacterium]